ncbi:MAG: methyltransferase domain-containing protein [Thermoanaerobaculia bacterium]|nr:methyltransferase domain-containing protein [Thermoanaerobaculia bacterium]
MTFRAPREAVEAAEAYESLHVPALFREWAPRVLAAAAVGTGDRVLDVACGTGVLARRAAALVGPAGRVAAIDPGPGMLAVAARLEPSVDWRQGVAEALPFDDRSFDAVVSQFGMMFFSDRREAVREMLRVLVPGGRLAVAVWDRLEVSEAYPVEVELLERLAGREAADALRAPFALGDREELAELLQAAGATSVAVASSSGTARFPSVRTMVEADLRGWLPVMGVVLEEAVIERVLREAEVALSEYVTPEGRVAFPAPAHVVTGRRP